MEWLHFSDFHFGRKRGAQNEAMNSLVDFIRKEFQTKPGKVDAVFLVGDIAYAGLKEEYENFEQDFLKPLLKIESIRAAKIFAVPGNHDVECDAANPITWEGIPLCLLTEHPFEFLMVVLALYGICPAVMFRTRLDHVLTLALNEGGRSRPPATPKATTLNLPLA